MTDFYSTDLKCQYMGETYLIADYMTIFGKELILGVKKVDFDENKYPLQTYLIPID